MWKPVLKYNKPTIAPTHHRKDIKILARVALRVFLKGRKPLGHCVFSVYTGGSVIEASEDGAILKVELDEYIADTLYYTNPTTLFIFERGGDLGLYSCQQIKQKHRLETLEHDFFLFKPGANTGDSGEKEHLSRLLFPEDSETEDILSEAEDVVATGTEKELGERAMESPKRRSPQGDVKPVIELFQLLKKDGFDDSKIHQKIVSTLECEPNRVKEIIHYYKAAEKDKGFPISDDFTICDATLCIFDNPEEYCKRNQYPLWHP